jgi:hypothetical protein
MLRRGNYKVLSKDSNRPGLLNFLKRRSFIAYNIQVGCFTYVFVLIP